MCNRNKTDEQLLAEANALDAAYAAADAFDLRKENEYLRKTLENLYYQVREDVPYESRSKHLHAAIEDAAEAIGLYLEYRV